MAYYLELDKTKTKEEKYICIIPQIKSLIKDEKNLIANLGNIASALKYTFPDFLWIGFYFVDDQNKNELVLGPFQGKVACTRIEMGSGVCGTSAMWKETIIVDDVEKFPGHIVCDPDSKSEIVVPIINNNQLKGVLDIDSNAIGNFTQVDKKYLEEMINSILYLF